MEEGLSGEPDQDGGHAEEGEQVEGANREEEVAQELSNDNPNQGGSDGEQSTESMAPLVRKKRKRTLVKVGDLAPSTVALSTGEVGAKRATIGNGMSTKRA